MWPHKHYFQNDDRWMIWKTGITISHKSTIIYHIFMYLQRNAYFTMLSINKPIR